MCVVRFTVDIFPNPADVAGSDTASLPHDNDTARHSWTSGRSRPVPTESKCGGRTLGLTQSRSRGGFCFLAKETKKQINYCLN